MSLCIRNCALKTTVRIAKVRSLPAPWQQLAACLPRRPAHRRQRPLASVADCSAARTSRHSQVTVLICTCPRFTQSCQLFRNKALILSSVRHATHDVSVIILQTLLSNSVNSAMFVWLLQVSARLRRAQARACLAPPPPRAPRRRWARLAAVCSATRLASRCLAPPPPRLVTPDSVASATRTPARHQCSDSRTRPSP